LFFVLSRRPDEELSQVQKGCVLACLFNLQNDVLHQSLIPVAFIKEAGVRHFVFPTFVVAIFKDID